MPQVTNPFQLQNVYVVTGGTRGIGRAISLQFGRAGAHVIANYLRDEEAALELKTVADEAGFPIEVLRADLTSPTGLEKIEARVKQLGMGLRGLVHCAATGTHRTLDALDGRHLEWTFALNVRALHDLVKRLLPLFEPGASILGISSMGAARALPQYAAIGASKGALESLIRHFAAELAPRGIRANVLRPGAVATDAWKVIPDAEARLGEAVRRSPIGRLIAVEELAFTAQFLCSTAASGINGQTLVADGGTSILA